MKCAGAFRRENVGMSNRNTPENGVRRKPEVSSAMAIIGGLGVPKDNPALKEHWLSSRMVVSVSSASDIKLFVYTKL